MWSSAVKGNVNGNEILRYMEEVIQNCRVATAVVMPQLFCSSLLTLCLNIMNQHVLLDKKNLPPFVRVTNPLLPFDIENTAVEF